MEQDRRPVGTGYFRTGCFPAVETFRYIVFIVVLLVCILVPSARAAHSPGLPDELPGPDWLDHWSFEDTTNWTSDLGYRPISFTNINSSPLGDGSAVVLDYT